MLVSQGTCHQASWTKSACAGYSATGTETKAKLKNDLTGAQHADQPAAWLSGEGGARLFWAVITKHPSKVVLQKAHEA